MRLRQVGRMILNSGAGLIQQQLKWVVAEVGNQDPKGFFLFYFMHVRRGGAVVFREQTFVWFD